MSFLRRLRGARAAGAPSEDASQDPEPADADPADAAHDEFDPHDLDVLRAEQARLDDLAQRQLRYAQYAWQPPAQGGERRADDHLDEGR